MHPDLAAFLDHLQTIQKSPRTVARYGDILRELEKFVDGADPSSFTREALRKFASAPRADGNARSPAGVNLRVAVLHVLFEFLVEERGYQTNPAAGVKGVRLPRRTPKHIPLPETLQLVRHVKACSGSLTERNVAIVTVFWQTGLRVSDLARLAVGQLDPQAALLRDVRVKGGHVLDVPVNTETIAVLGRYLEARGQLDHDDPLFARADGERLSVRAIQALFEGWRRELGWTRPLHPHVLRHAHATHLLGLGVGIETVARSLTHEDLRTVMVYTTVEDPALREGLRKLGGLMPAELLVEAKPATRGPATATAQRLLVVVPSAGAVSVPDPAAAVRAVTEKPCAESSFGELAA